MQEISLLPKHTSFLMCVFFLHVFACANIGCIKVKFKIPGYCSVPSSGTGTAER